MLVTHVCYRHPILILQGTFRSTTATVKRSKYDRPKTFKIFYKGLRLHQVHPLDLPLQVVLVDCRIFMYRSGTSEIFNSILKVSLK